MIRTGEVNLEVEKMVLSRDGARAKMPVVLVNSTICSTEEGRLWVGKMMGQNTAKGHLVTNRVPEALHNSRCRIVWETKCTGVQANYCCLAK